MTNFHGRLMNIPATRAGDYYEGHRDARHAAAEIGNEADNEIAALKARLAEAVLHVPAHAELRIQHLEARLAEWDKAADFYRRCKTDPKSDEVGAMRDAVEWLCSIAARAADSADEVQK